MKRKLLFLFNVFKKHSVKIIAFFILELFIISISPICADTHNNRYSLDSYNLIYTLCKKQIYEVLHNKGKSCESIPILISSTIDETNNKVFLNWTQNKNELSKYYVFKLEKGKNFYELISSKNGITGNSFVDRLNNGDKYVVSLRKDFNKVPKWLCSLVVRNADRDKVSNIIRIDTANCISPRKPGITGVFTRNNNVHLNWDSKSNNTTYMIYRDAGEDSHYWYTGEASFTDNDVSPDAEPDYYLWAIDESGNTSIPAMYLTGETSGDNTFPVCPAEETIIQYFGITLEIPAGAVSTGSQVIINSLGTGYLNKIPSNSVNIIGGYPACEGFDISLNGSSSNTFLKDIKITFSYDESKIPGYLDENSAFIYYYDEDAEVWRTLTRENLDTTTNTVSSFTDHFCQFYCGAMTMQTEPPQAKGINTDPVNLDTIDPMTGIRGLPGITPNNKGTAGFSYPIIVPDGINGLTPGISIRYSSAAKHGNCGYGFTIGASKITIKNKNSLPQYNDNDIYLLDGDELVNIEPAVRSTSDMYYRLKDDDKFYRIMKMDTELVIPGGGVSEDQFLVEKSDSTKLYYGLNNDSREYNPDDETQIFSWYITRVVDKFGNEINYEYERYGNKLYVKKIKYGYNDSYIIEFNWVEKTDKTKTYRSKFEILNDRLLSGINVYFTTTLIRNYDLNYISGAFEKTLLSGIIEKSGDNILNDISFTYDTSISSFFSGEKRLVNYSSDDNEIEEGDLFLLGDITGDKLMDCIRITDDKDVYYRKNTGGGFKDQKYYDDVTDVNIYSEGFIDMNGDTLPDYTIRGEIDESGTEYHINLNKGNKFTSGSTWSCSGDIDISRSYGLYDIDGDNLLDFTSWEYTGDSLTLKYRKNNGSGFISQTEYDTLSAWSEYNRSFIDINGDNLVDLHFIRSSKGYVEYNNGVDISSREEFIDSSNIISSEDCLKYADINGDGLMDMIRIYTPDQEHPEEIEIYYRKNEGLKWDQNEVLILTSDDLENPGFMDIDGDGFVDIVNPGHMKIHENGLFKWYKNQLGTKNILKSVTNNVTGVKTDLEYVKVITEYGSKNVLNKITTGNDDLSFITNIGYSNGKYDRYEKSFIGFENLTISTVDTDKNVTHSIEKNYRMSDYNGTYGYINKYDEYLTGRINSVRAYINRPGYGKLLMNRTDYKYEKIDLLDPEYYLDYNNEVKHINIYETRVWMYNEEGDFIGSDSTNGDVGSTTSLVIDNTCGLITKVSGFSYNDPHHNLDDIQSVSDIAINTETWTSTPYKMETIDIYNNTRINMVLSYFDNLAEGEIGNGVLTSIKTWNNNGDDPETAIEYDSYGNISKITDHTGQEINKVTAYSTDFANYIYEQVILPDGLSVSTNLDGYRRVTETIDVYGDSSEYYYDLQGRLASIKNSIDSTLKTTKKYSYGTTVIDNKIIFYSEAISLTNESGDIENDADNLRIQVYKDELGRMIQAKTESVINGIKKWSVTGNVEYDTMGRVITAGSAYEADYVNEGYIEGIVEDPVTYYAYDDFSRLCETELPCGLIITNEFSQYVDADKIIYRSTAGDNQGHETTALNDYFGALVKSMILKENEEYAETGYEYNLHGWAQVTLPNGETGEKQLDSIGKLMWMHSPDAGKSEYTYNSKGLVEKVTDYGRNIADTNLREIYYTYDTLNRITGIDFTGTENDITYEYYGTGSSVPKYAKSGIKSIAKGSYYSVQYNYGQLWIEEDKNIEGSNYLTKYEYDIQGRIKKLTYPDNEIVTYSYDEGGSLTNITGNQVYIQQILYDKYGQRSYLKYGNNSEMTYTYDPETLLLDIFITKDKDGNEILRYDYDWDQNSNITRITDSPTGTFKSEQTYSYDLLSRLTGAAGNYSFDGKTDNYIRSYTYDDNNRITEKTFEDGKIYSFNYLNNSHEVSSIDITGGESGQTSINFDYDDFGNMINKKIYAGAVELENTDFTYDVENKLTSIDLPDNFQLDFKYDAAGQRIKKVYSDNIGVINESIYVNAFYTVTNGNTNKHITDGNYIIATKLDDDTDKIKYYHSNHIGSTALLTDNNGDKWQSYLYTPYGETWITENPSADDDEITRRFTGQEFDQESGLYYYNARYFDPHIGMFTRPDPAMDGLNHYAYANCNPVMYNDPTGFAADGCDFADEETDPEGVSDRQLDSSYESGGLGSMQNYTGDDFLGVMEGNELVIEADRIYGDEDLDNGDEGENSRDNNSIDTIDKSKKADQVLKNILDFFRGILDTIIQNSAPFLDILDPYPTNAYKMGQFVGNILSLVIAAYEIVAAVELYAYAVGMFIAGIASLAGGPPGIAACAIAVSEAIAIAAGATALLGLGLNTGKNALDNLMQMSNGNKRSNGKNRVDLLKDRQGKKFAKDLEKMSRSKPLNQIETERAIEIAKEKGLSVRYGPDDLAGKHFKEGIPHIHISERHIKVLPGVIIE